MEQTRIDFRCPACNAHVNLQCLLKRDDGKNYILAKCTKEKCELRRGIAYDLEEALKTEAKEAGLSDYVGEVTRH